MNQTSHVPGPSDGPHFCAYVKSLPYDKRWEALRPVLEPLFHSESIKDIAKMMLDRYKFNASETQYKYRFNKVWRLQKNIPEAVKVAAIRKGQERAKQGKQSIAKYRGRAIPVSRFRLTNDISAKISSLSLRDLFTFPLDKLDMFGRYTPFGNNILLAWNMPFGTQPLTRHVLSPRYDISSPYSTQMGNTPADLEITTPSEQAQSPMNVLVATRDSISLTPAIREQRVKLFLEGKLPELLKALSQQERSDVSEYLYHFWHFSFVSAQGWSPYSTPTITHTPTVMDFETENTNATIPSPRSPTFVGSEPCDLPGISLPSQVCGWAIHVTDASVFFGIPWASSNTISSPPRSDPNVVALDNEMRTALQNSSFTNIPPSNLAVPLPDLVSKVRHHEYDLLSEAISFAIMGRNLDLLRELLSKLDDALLELGDGDFPRPEELREALTDMNINFTQALHLAATYMDGGATCCLIIHQLARTVLDYDLGLGNLLNDNKHTLIDDVLLTVLRNHSRATLNIIDPQLGKMAKFSGQEVDICGRWSATSACFQSLVAAGEEQIPWSWKHKFCRTSAQTTCHSLSILIRCFALLKEQDSGLFSIRCINTECGQLFTLTPLHAVVMTGFYLIRYGAQDEDLFGILACYLCLVGAGVDTLTCKEISTLQFLGVVEDEICDHRPLTAAEFAREIFDMMYRWDVTEPSFTGFAVLLAIMEETEQAAKDIKRIAEQIQQTESDLVHDFEDIRSWWIFNDENFEETFIAHGDGHVEASTMGLIVAEQVARRESIGQSFPSMCSNENLCDFHLRDQDYPAFGNSTKLGHIWAAVQAEFASSERRGIEGQHLSSSFDMQRLLSSLRSNSKPDIGHVQNGTLNAYCRCGKFSNAEPGLATRESMFLDPSHGLGDDVEVWSRISIIQDVKFSEFPYED